MQPRVLIFRMSMTQVSKNSPCLQSRNSSLGLIVCGVVLVLMLWPRSEIPDIPVSLTRTSHIALFYHKWTGNTSFL